MSRSRQTAAALLVSWLVTASFAGTTPAQANGIGDLYAAATGGVLELHVASGRIVQQVKVPSTPSGIAFSNDARSLYLAAGATRLDQIDIETISLADSISLPIDVVAVAVPKGVTAVAAGPGRPRLLLASLTDGTVTETDRLSAAPNLVSADRRDRRAMAARSGESWVAIVDSANGAVTELELTGKVVGLAVDRAGGAGFVVTRAPNRLTRVRLDKPAIDWEVALPELPTAVVSTAFGPIVAAADGLWRSNGKTATSWLAEGSPRGILAASDDGAILYLGQAMAILAFDATGELRQTIALPDDRLRGLAAFPAPSSLSGAAPSGSTSGSATTPAVASAMPGIELPATSTVAAWIGSWTDAPAPFVGALAIFTIILGLGVLVLRRRSAPD